MRSARQYRPLPFLVPALLVTACLTGADTPPVKGDPAEAGIAEPWSESFTMVLKDRDRAFVVYDGTTWMMMEAGDLKDPAFLNGKEITFLGKYERTESDRAFFFGLDNFTAFGGLQWWANRVEGDNLHLFGNVTVQGKKVRMNIRKVVAAESDAQIVAQRAATVAPEDWQGRLALVTWAREQAETQGNRDWWTLAAETLLVQTIDTAAAQANDKKDAKLLSTAFTWALTDLQDVGLAARLASAPWFTEQTEAINAAKQLQARGYDRYKDVWRKRADSLTLQFEDQLTTIPWRDAEGFYKLGRWTDRHAEDLPRARDLSFRAYQAGYRADQNHAGIRRELGLSAGSGSNDSGSTSTMKDRPYHDAETGIMVGGPEGWASTPATDTNAKWIDLNSETAYLTVTILGANKSGGNFDTAWDRACMMWNVRDGFREIDTTSITPAIGQGRRMQFEVTEGMDQRQAELAMAFDADSGIAVVIATSGLPNEHGRVQAALYDVLSKISLPSNQNADTGDQLPTDGVDIDIQEPPAE